jgi:hypothetical protein
MFSQKNLTRNQNATVSTIYNINASQNKWAKREFKKK